MHSSSTCQHEHGRPSLTRLMLLWALVKKYFGRTSFWKAAPLQLFCGHWTGIRRLDVPPRIGRQCQSLSSPSHRHLPSFPSSVRITPFFLFLSGLSADSTSFSRLIPLPGLEVSARHRGKESPDAKMATYSKFTFERLQISQSRNAIYASLGGGRSRRSNEKVSARHENDRPSHST